MCFRNTWVWQTLTLLVYEIYHKSTDDPYGWKCLLVNQMETVSLPSVSSCLCPYIYIYILSGIGRINYSL